MLIPALIIIILLNKAGVSNLIYLSKKARFSFIALAVIFYFASNAVRSLRFSLLLEEKRPGFLDLFYVTSVYNFMTAMLPGGTGELSYPLLLRRTFGRPIGTGLSSVILTRLNDIFLLSICFLFTSTIAMDVINARGETVLFIIPFFLILLIFFSDFMARGLSRCAEYLGQRTKWRIVNRIQGLLNDTVDSLQEAKSAAMYLRIIFHTLVMWLSTFLFFYLVFIAFGNPITFVQAVFIGTAMNMLTIIPINTFGGFGLKEATLAGLLLLIGMDQDTAVSLGILVRLVSILTLFALLAFSFTLKKSAALLNI